MLAAASPGQGEEPASLDNLRRDCERAIAELAADSDHASIIALKEIAKSNPELLREHSDELFDLLLNVRQSNRSKCEILLLLSQIDAAHHATPDQIKTVRGKAQSEDTFLDAYAGLLLCHRADTYAVGMEVLTRQLSSDIPQARWVAAWVVGSIPEVPEDVLQLLEDRLEDADVTVRTYAAEAYAKHGGDASKATAVLNSVLRSPGQACYVLPPHVSDFDLSNRAIAMGILTKLCPAGQEPISDVAALARSSDAQEQSVALQTLTKWKRAEELESISKDESVSPFYRHIARR
ncbi:MAG: hypothetical protein KDA66_16650, partial [Planctomycetaceae bacterium]|nr:hypothetical protein [Planctomycetaceae bacterium]